MRSHFWIAAALATSIGTEASAASFSFTQEFTDSFGPATTEIVSKNISGNAPNVGDSPLLLPQFDPSTLLPLQTVVGVQYEIEMLFGSTGTLRNTSSGENNFRFRSTAEGLLESILFPGINGFGGQLGNLVDTGFITLDAGAPLADPAPPGSTTSYQSGDLSLDPPVAGLTLTTGLQNAAGPIAQYLGTGDIRVDYESIISTSFTGGGGNVNNDQVTDAIVRGRIIYTIREDMPPSDVPVPAALPLLATALGGIGFMRWRRKRA